MSIRPSRAFLDQLVIDREPDIDADAREAVPGEIVEIRYETFSPVEEYAVREGRTEALDEEFHAVLSMDHKGVGTVTANGLLIKETKLVGFARRKLGVTYWHPDSDLCNRVAEGPVQVRYTYNPARPDVVHLWDLNWRYLESLPARERVPILDNAALAEAAKHAKRQVKRFGDTLQDLQSEASHKAIADLRHNAAELDRVAVQLPLAGEAAPRPQASRESSATPGFDRGRQDADGILEAGRITRNLIDEAESDLAAVRANRRAAAPVHAVYDLLDDL